MTPEPGRRSEDQRTTELERLNSLMTRSAERIANADNLDGVLTGFLHESCELTGAYCATLFRRSSETVFVPLAGVYGDRALTAQELLDDPAYQDFVDATEFDQAGFFARIARGERLILAAEDFGPCLPRGLEEYHRRAGNQAVWHLPLFRQKLVVGYLALGMPRTEPPSETELQQLQSICGHMTLAIELHRLADREQQAAVLQERARMSRDIHDTLAQGFLAIILHLEAARDCFDTEPDHARQLIESTVSVARSNLEEARLAVRLLRDDRGRATDLVMMLADITAAAMAEGLFPIKFTTTVSHCPTRLHEAEQLVRIAAEAIRNARRHAKATMITVGLALDMGRYVLSVADDGVGFEPARYSEAGRYGLIGMRERATNIGAELAIETSTGQGTVVRVSWPATAEK